MGSHPTLAHQLANETLELDHRNWIHDHHGMAERTAEQAFDRLNPDYGVPADRQNPYGRQALRDREAALVLGTRVAVASSRENDPNPVMWLAGQDYRVADATHRAHLQTIRHRHGPERLGPER
jgi:hypothetical protein